MSLSQRRVEVFSAGCPACEPVVKLVESLACLSCHVEVLDMRKPAVAEKAKQYGVTTVPAVAIDGELAGCCTGTGPTAKLLRAAGLGVPR